MISPFSDLNLGVQYSATSSQSDAKNEQEQQR